MRIDHDAPVDGDSRVLQPVEIGADARRHDHLVGYHVVALLKAQPLAAIGVFDGVELRPGANRNAAVLQPPRHHVGPGRVDHARQNLRRDLHHRKLGAQFKDGIQNGEGDEAGSDEHHRTARGDPPDDALRLFQGPEAVDARTVSPGDRCPDRRRASGDEQVVVRELGVPSSSVRMLACVSTPTARRPMSGSTPKVRSRVGGAVKTCDSLMLPFR